MFFKSSSKIRSRTCVEIVIFCRTENIEVVHEIIILRWGHQTRFARSDPTRLEEKEQKKAPFRELSFSLMTSVAGPEVASGLKDYEPFVHCTLPRM